MRIGYWGTGMGVVLGLTQACSDAPRAPTPATPPVDPGKQTDPTPADKGEVQGGQTGSGGVPRGFRCEEIASTGCGPSLLEGFGKAETPLIPAGSRCVPASELDPSLDDVPVCRCAFSRSNYFSDTGSSSELVYTVGLARRRITLAQAGDSCEVRLGDECLLDSAAFSGCSLQAAESSCESACGALSTSYAAAVAQRLAQVEVLSSECVECRSGTCFGVLRVRGACYLGMQSSLGSGYVARAIPCNATPEQTLDAEIERYGSGSNCTRHEAPACATDSEAICTDAGARDAAVPSLPADTATTDASSASIP